MYLYSLCYQIPSTTLLHCRIVNNIIQSGIPILYSVSAKLILRMFRLAVGLAKSQGRRDFVEASNCSSCQNHSGSM